MNKIILILKIAIVGLLFSACQKNGYVGFYEDVTRIVISGGNSGGISADGYSFALFPKTTTEHTLYATVRIMGEMSAADREFVLEVQQDSTTATPDEYELPTSFVIKAGEISSQVPIRIKRSSRLETRNVRLVLSIKPNNHFQLFGSGEATFLWTDQLVEPNLWGNHERVWGKYSRNKYRLLLDATEIKDWSTLTTGQVYYIAGMGREALAAHYANGGAPILNDQGFEIEICSNCN